MNSSDFIINTPSDLIPENLTTEILKKSDALNFHKSLSFYQQTPLIHLPHLAKHFGIENIYLKDESFRFGLNAFKGLGASYAIHKILSDKPGAKTFCTATDGNHGRAVAWSAKLAGRKAVIFVPADISGNRVKAIENEGGRIVKTDMNYDYTCDYAKEVSRKEGWHLVQDTSSNDYEEIPAQIMAGYLTLFQELESSLHTLPKASDRYSIYSGRSRQLCRFGCLVLS